MAAAIVSARINYDDHDDDDKTSLAESAHSFELNYHPRRSWKTAKTRSSFSRGLPKNCIVIAGPFYARRHLVLLSTEKICIFGFVDSLR